MKNIAAFYRLKARFSAGKLTIARGTKVPGGVRLVWRQGRIDIGSKVLFRPGVTIYAQHGFVDIGDNVSLNDNAILYGAGGIRIGNDVRIAAQVLITSADHNYADRERLIRDQGISAKPIVVEDDVWIGAGAKILAGAHIGKGCVIGANALVKGRTEPYGVYVGSPARLIKMRGSPSNTDVEDGQE